MSLLVLKTLELKELPRKRLVVGLSSTMTLAAVVEAVVYLLD